MTTDPTITIAGLRAQVESLETSLRGSLDDVAAGEEVRLISEAEHAAVAAERTALAAQLAEVRAEQTRRVAADLSRDAAESVGADQIAILRADLASERAHLAACRTRIAGLEAAANNHRAEIDAAVGQLASARQVTDERTAERDPEVFAGVSEDELCRIYGDAFNPAAMDPRADAIRVVLARLKTTRVAPVDPEAVARAYHDCEAGPVSSVVPYWRAMGGDQALSVTAMRTALLAAGVPVTPERGK